MPNVIQYNTGATPAGCLRRGNMLVGNNTADYGGTFYTGITPGAGGYTIYANKPTGGPSIVCPPDAAGLIYWARAFSGSAYSTAAESLNYFATQTDKICVNRDYEQIVTDGLVLNLDAGFTPSYPTSGTSWYDLGLSNNTGDLSNGPTFSSLNGGSIMFDGADDFVGLSDYPIPNNFSYCIWVKRNGNGDQGTRGIVISNGTNYIDVGFNNTILFSLVLLNGGQNLIQSPNGVIAPLGVWAHYAATYNRQQAKLYFNGVEVASSNYTLAPTNSNTTFRVGCWDRGGFCLNGNISIAQMYSKALTAAEVLQNYNAQKSRYGL